MTPEQCMARAIELTLSLQPNQRLFVSEEWPEHWPEPEAVAWMLAHMLAQTIPGASVGFGRRAPPSPIDTSRTQP